ncbi:MAG: 3-oxoacyl-[acyl-carrier-protein] reductase FabG [Alphaproteobacteria bacterium MarineAlpha9_Bin3]|nr:MAG: 3-oxoacyl-[acyl-carrier-protein] reductase FabG [Alphaproteobacteria bacterium MarineAlpha9_Bin3]|tara:strand:- start:4110 stop:4847 length:738 start_codon:yes stop_codon:yes gene_type:complete
MFNLENKTALVTGASGGIGEAIAFALNKQGAKVCITGTNEDKLNNINKKSSMSYSQVICNLKQREDLKNLVGNVEKEIGNIDILVNNAGITYDQLAMRMSEEMWDDVLATNLYASFFLSKSVMRNMMKKKFGRIIQISSVVGFTGNPGQSNYVASKAALVGMTKSLALEVASRNITVNCIAPGFIKTSMTDALNEDQKNALLEKIPSRKFGLPEDIAAAAVYLSSDEASYINGSTIHLNGGLAMI